MKADDPKATPSRELEAANVLFHDAYERARSEASREPTVFVMLADDLVVVRAKEKKALRFTPDAFHELKAAVHVAVGLYAALHGAGEAPLTHAARHRVKALGAHARKALAAPPPAVPEAVSHYEKILRASVALAEAVEGDDRFSPAQLEAFALELRQPILGLTDEATALQLAGLHARVEEALAALPAEACRALQVVVAGDHQARRRSLGMQYFQRRLGEADGEEERLLYGENVTNLEEALALVGTQRVDRALAKAFFGERKRMQRDLLGDSAKKQLEGMDLPRIG